MSIALPMPPLVRTALPRMRALDPRVYQISILASLLVYGVFALDFEVRPLNAVVQLLGVLATQWVCTKLWKLPAYDPKSALISGLSLCLLVRTNSPLLALA